ncbi:hypothetical protein Tco_0625114 [Tanacetum coccineum]|uniref:Uncharacterized protein n=1 Tax=Tanacetum coccineum TaxID=301880 RepID=A0ABQ4WFU6_9ASTR
MNCHKKPPGRGCDDHKGCPRTKAGKGSGRDRAICEQKAPQEGQCEGGSKCTAQSFEKVHAPHQPEIWLLVVGKIPSLLWDQERKRAPPLPLLAQEELLQMFEQEVRLLKKARAQVVETEVHGLRNQTKNLETLLEAEVGRSEESTEAKNAERGQGTQVTSEERIKVVFEEFKKYKDDRVEKRCAEMDARLDALSIDFDEEFDTGEDAPQWICELRPSSSQLIISVYPEVRDPKDPWACKEEILLGDANRCNISHAKRRKRVQVVCQHFNTVWFCIMPDPIVSLLSVPTVAPQGLAHPCFQIATPDNISEDEHLRGYTYPSPYRPMYNLDLAIVTVCDVHCRGAVLGHSISAEDMGEFFDPILVSLAQAGLDSFPQALVCSFYESIRLCVLH